ncbi:MAG: nucleotidyl transferase AbiEii/AbiGii toxin family protein [Solirubrobacterales bacterium]|nr:nucleotidyl transferase AbiEii/AbiGii toxin family protein [Solirubrobacterales bacterium]
MSAPSRATEAGRAYLDLRKKAGEDRRPFQELLQLYVLEGYLARLAASPLIDQFVLKGGVLLAALGERRPTRDVDLQAQELDNDADAVRDAVCDVARIDLDDGIVFDVDAASAEVIRDEDLYSGVRVSMTTELATARPHFHVDVSVGDPITPSPVPVRVPRLLGGEIVVRGYPLPMIHAEKIVTAVSRGTVSTRWRDFADIYLLTRHHPVEGAELVRSISHVAVHRQTSLAPLASVLDGYADIGQQRWVAWRRRQKLEDRLPERFRDVVDAAIAFADPAIDGAASGLTWDPTHGVWR